MGFPWEDENNNGTSSLTEFEFYEPTAVDPGATFVVGVVLVCVGLNCLLPILLCLRERMGWGSQCNSRPRDKKDEVDENDEDDNKSQSSLESSPSSMVSSVVSEAFNTALDGLEKQRHHKNHRQRFAHLEDTPVMAATTSAASEPNDLASQAGTDSNSAAIHPDDAISCQDNEEPTQKGDAPTRQSAWSLMLEIADLDKRTYKLWSLFWPYSAQSIIGGIFDLVETALVGYYLGVQEQNVVLIVSTLKGFTKTIRSGFSGAFGVLAPQAKGASNDLLVGRYLQMCMILYTIANLPGIVIWFFCTERAVLWFGFDAETAALAQRMVYPSLVASFFAGMDSLMFEFVDVLGFEKYGIILEFVYYGTDTLIVIFVLVVAKTQDLVLLRVIQNAVGLLLMIGNFSYISYKGWFDPYWEGFIKTNGFKDRRALRTVLITALPMSFAYILTDGEWELLYIFVRSIGPAEVAAWGLLNDIWGVFEDMVSEISGATEVRVGYYMGAGDIVTARMMSYKGIYLSATLSCLTTAGLFIFAEDIPKILTPDPTLRKMMFDTLPLIGIGQLLMCVTDVCWSIMEAQGRTRLATIIEVFTSWGLLVPLTALSVYGFNYNLVGIVGALLVGYTASNILIGYLTFTSDWKYLSELVIERNGKHNNDDEAEAVDTNAMSYEDYDWDDLPPEIHKAAETLGYNKQSWDEGERTPCDAKIWSELTQEEQEAARQIGYNESSWDTDSSSSNSSSGSSSSSSSEGPIVST